MKITAEEITESTILTTITELFPKNLYTISITRDDTLELDKIYIYKKKPDLNIDVGYFIDDLPKYSFIIKGKKGSKGRISS